MGLYFLKRLLFLLPTLFGILLLNFVIIHTAPGGPIEHIISKIRGHGVEEGPLHTRIASKPDSLSHEQLLVKELEKRYGFDKPLTERFWMMIKNYATFDLGKSYFKGVSVAHLLKEKLPVSLSLGLWSTLLIYLVSIPLGIKKALKNREPFDVWSSILLIIAYAVPAFLVAFILILFFAGGHFWSWFPLRGLTSANWDQLSFLGKVKDYVWHMTLPITAEVVGGVAVLTFFTKNSFLEEMKKTYVVAARSQGFTERALLFRHIFRNALLVLIAGLPTTLLGILLSGSILIEMIFSLDGIGLLGLEAITVRDYPIIFGTLYIYTLLGLVLHLVSDLLAMVLDPRIDFRKNS